MGFFCSEDSQSDVSKGMEAMIWRPLAKSSLVALFLVVLTLGAFMCTRYYLDSSVAVTFIAGNSPQKPISNTKPMQNTYQETLQSDHYAPKSIDIPLNCSLGNLSRACPANYYPSSKIFVETKNISTSVLLPPPSCPDYFRWIHDDLWRWRETGITEEMVMSARPMADFRLVILNGKAYVQTYRKSFQSRDTFTLWGILQLLRRYPGKIPDLDLMFDCSDRPPIDKRNLNSLKNPALFRYCGDDSTLEIVFPDWSFWGWPEINIKPWEALSKDLKEGNKRSRWMEREAHAYWKGNPAVSGSRQDLLKCNITDKQDWNARLYAQDWKQEERQGFKQSDLASQCIHRYKIYIEGVAWSVSEKYILACDSVTLLVKPRYYDFFTRSLMPLQHYWPIKDYDKCRSIKYAVEWGNSHQQEAQAMGKAGSSFIHEELMMDYVYDYMFYLLSEYAKLLKYKPTLPEGAVEICSESIACLAQGLEKKYLLDSLVKGPTYSNPCTMPPPYDPTSFHSFLERKDSSIKQVELLEKEYWDRHNMQKM